MRSAVLVVDDERAMCDLIADHLGRRGFRVEAFTAADDALRALGNRSFGAVITDLIMPEIGGIELCERIVQSQPAVPVIVLTAFGSIETAVEAMRAGAFDFVTKPIEMELLEIAVRRAIRHHALHGEVERLSEEVHRTQGVGDLIGDSESMRRLFDQIIRVADSEATILITGESGTGKELVARAIHQNSRRSDGPLVAVNCAALPHSLLESELFGHVRGAFTGAHEAREGLFLRADGGSIYLDEIGELPLELQPKLLRALEESCVRPVGSDHEVRFDARIIGATNRDLEDLVARSRFRQDLYYRINVVEVEVPPLRSRSNDVLLLADRFVSECAGKGSGEAMRLSQSAARLLTAYDWPGNVRELRNAIERAHAFATSDCIIPDDLPKKVRLAESRRLVVGGTSPEDLEPLAQVERRYIIHALKVHGGNRTMTARSLGCNRKTLYRKLKAYNIEDG